MAENTRWEKVLACIENGDYWIVRRTRDMEDCFFMALAEVFIDDAFLYVEGTSMTSGVQEFLRANHRAGAIELPPPETQWPLPQVYVIPINKAAMAGLTAISRHHAAPEVCDHIRVFWRGDCVVQWTDYPLDDLWVYACAGMSEEKVAQLAALAGTSFKRCAEGE